jgi:hypothetical protein
MSSARGRAPAGSGQDYPGQAASYEQAATGYPMDEREARYAAERGGGVGAWAGSALAGTLMIISGATGFLGGLAKVVKGGFFTFNSTYPYHWTTHGWGWTELIIGGLLFAAGVGVFLGMTWARAVGVLIATAYAVVSFLTIPFYPVWSLILIALNVFVIWALLTRGRRQRV